ncbi:MAG: hypothetical protein ACYC6G_11465 [Desulfobaccales bacterium]
MKWCDLSCEAASFPKTEAVDGSGSCRTFAALYCAKLNRLVHKHGPCQCPEEADAPAGLSPKPSPGLKEPS